MVAPTIGATDQSNFKGAMIASPTGAIVTASESVTIASLDAMVASVLGINSILKLTITIKNIKEIHAYSI